MSIPWFLFSIFGPPVLAVAAAVVFRSGAAPPLAIVALNGLMPGSGLAAAGRPLLEIAFGVLFAQISMLVSQGPHLEYLGPIAFIGAAWGLIYTPWNPLTAQGVPERSRPVERILADLREQVAPGPSVAVAPRETVGAMARQNGDDKTSDAVECYSVAVRCTECGAQVDVPVLDHAAQCGFCGSHHLVVGQEEVLQVTLPAKAASRDDLRETVLDHLRYRYYLKLYRRSVAPLERQATEVGPSGGMSVRADVEAAAAAAERVVSLKADRYRVKLSAELEITRTQQFVAPYGHAMGTLYQAAFGRDRRTQDKVVAFTMGAVETSVAAQTTLELPAMGKLSYLKALVPAVQLAGDSRALPFALAAEDIDRVRQDLQRKQLDRSIQTIKLGSTFVEEVRAVVWRPWWVAEVQASGAGEVLLIDAAAGSVAGPGAFLDPSTLVELPPEARDSGAALRFQPMQCPTCGFEFRYEVDAVLHFCLNCHRLFEADGTGKTEIEYECAADGPSDQYDVVPFWRFPLRLATSDQGVITDLMHLKDGIDGTLDQIGEGAQPGQDDLWIPAIRCINTRLMAAAFSRLFVFAARNPPQSRKGRFPLDVKVEPWPVCLDEEEVRSFASLYLANVFEPRDIARVNIHQVTAWIFEGRLESRGHLAYLPIPREVTRPFRGYIGRYRGRAVAEVTGNR